MGLTFATAPVEVATSIEISYAAHTSSCTFLLDDQGICRRIVLAPKSKRREAARTSARCVGAQYVASLDGSAAGGLVEMPRVGAAMLFARVDENGRVSLVRTGLVTSFESRAGEDPFVESVSVETSAPQLAGLETVRAEQAALAAAQALRDLDYQDPCDRTQRIQALRPADYDNIDDDDDRTEELGNDLATAEYRSVADYPSHASHAAPSARPTLPSEPPPTVRRPPSPASRGVLPRRSDPKIRAAGSAAPAWEPSQTPPDYGSDVHVTRRRRGG